MMVVFSAGCTPPPFFSLFPIEFLRSFHFRSAILFLIPHGLLLP